MNYNQMHFEIFEILHFFQGNRRNGYFPLHENQREIRC